MRVFAPLLRRIIRKSGAAGCRMILRESVRLRLSTRKPAWSVRDDEQIFAEFKEVMESYSAGSGIPLKLMGINFEDSEK